MARGKKTGGRDFEPGNQAGIGFGRPRIPDDIREARSQVKGDFERTLIQHLYKDGNMEQLVTRFMEEALKFGDPRRFEIIMDRILGKPKEIIEVMKAPVEQGPCTFTDFCVKAGYPPPYPKQIEMLDFGMNKEDTRLLLGSRGYGKTDYITILGVAYKIYLKGANYSCLIVTKEKKRASAIIGEIASALKLNGVDLEKENSSCIRVKGRIGKDHSVEGLSIKSGLRGRHPDEALMDDPVTEEDVSEAMRDTVERKYSELLKLTKNVLIIGQPAHKEDLYAKLRPLLLKMEVPHGTIPELDHDLLAMAAAGIDQRSIEMSYHLKVPMDGTNPFDQVKYCDDFPTGGSVAFIDPSFTGGDYTALSIVRQYMQGVFVVGFVYKKAWNHCLDEIWPELQKYDVRRLAFETNSLGDMPISMLRQAFPGLGIVGRVSNTQKHARIMAAGSYAHVIHLSKQSHKTYIDHVVKYEYKSKFDDAPDSLASCLEWLGLVRGKK